MTQLASDNFQRSNETPLSDGGAWALVSGSHNLNLTSNLCVPSQTTPGGAGCSMYWSPVSWPSNQYVAATVNTLANFNGGGDDCAGLLRISGTAFYVSGIANQEFGTTGLGNPCLAFIGYFNGTFEIELGARIVTANVGDVFLTSIHEQTFLLSQNGTVILLCTDTNLASGPAGAHVKVDTVLANSKMSLWSAGLYVPNYSVFSDTFARADGALGSNWLNVSTQGTPAISSNQATNPTNNALAVSPSIATDYYRDQYAQARISQLSSGNFSGVAVRVSGNGTNSQYGISTPFVSWYSLMEQPDGTIALQKIVGSNTGSFGTITNLQVVSGTSVVGDVLRLEVRGVNPTTLTGYKNGVQIVSQTDNPSLVGGHPGISFFSNGTGVNNFTSGSFAIASLNLTSSSVLYPAGATGTVTLAGTFLTDTVVTLSSSDSTVATVPSTVTVLAGQSTATFPVTSQDKSGSVTITASFNGTSGTASLTVTVPPPATHTVSGRVIGPGGAHTTVNLSGTSSSTTTTDANGAYSFTGLSNGNYTIIPSNPGYLKPGQNGTFLKPNHFYVPDSQNIIIGGSDAAGINFTSYRVRPGNLPYVLRDFGCSGNNPSYLATTANTLQLFEQPSFVPNVNPGTVIPPPWSTTGTPDSFNYQGRVQMPGQLLVAPGTGSLNGKIYQIVAEGSIVIPSSASGAGFSLVMNENYTTFGQAVISDALFSQILPVSVAAGSTVNWYLIATLAGNGIGTPVLSSAGILSVNGVTYYGNGFSNRLVGREPIVQLSFGVLFSGNSGGGIFEAYLSKFQMTQTPY